MDEQEIRDLWKKIVTEQGDNHAVKENLTFKGYSVPQQKKANLPRLTFSQQDMLELFSNENEETHQESKMELENTIIDNFAKIKNLNIGNPSANYQIFDEIARGGMGVIYRGKQLSLQREIAVKKLLQNNNTVQLRDKFINEAIVTAFLDHPNIIPVHELGVNEDGDIVLAMKLVKGTSWKAILHQESEESKKYDIFAHINILLSVCNAVAFAHSKNIVHCDLKPDNVMIGAFGEILVMDWGIAVDISDEGDKKALAKKDVNSPMGTPHYMPEELARGWGKNIGPWTDIYLLGGILYEIICHKPPHKGNNIWRVINTALEGPKLEFSEGVPGELQGICRKALQKDRTRRYQNIAEFSQDISSFLQHRESIIISDKAQKVLEECNGTVAKVTSSQLILQKRERSQLYDQFAQCVARFQQAIELWEKNEYAQKGIEEAYLKYAQIAFHNGDLGLAEAQISKLSYHVSEVKALKDKIQHTKISKLKAMKNNQMVRVLLKISVIMIIIVLVGSVILIYNNAKEAYLQRQIADERRIEADKQREIADEKRIEADEQKQIADEKRIEADRQKEEATLLQTQKMIDAHHSRIKLAHIALSKSFEADKREEWDRSGAYAGEALEFIKDIESESGAIDDEYKETILKEINNIKKIAQLQIKQALQNRYQLWKTPSLKNIFSRPINKIKAGSDIIVTCSKETLYLWTVQGEIITSIDHDKDIRDIAIHPHLKIIASTTGNSIKLWDLDKRVIIKEIVRRYRSVKQILFSPDGKHLIYTENNFVKLWDISSHKTKRLWQHDKVDKIIYSGNKLISIAQDNTIKCGDFLGENISSITINENINIETFVQNHDGFTYCAKDSNVIHFYSFETQNITKIITDHKTAIKILVPVVPKNIIISISYDNSIKIWNYATRDLQKTIEENLEIKGLEVLSHTLEQMVIVFQQSAKIYDLAKQIPNSFPGHKHKINLLQFSPDNNKIISASKNGSIKLWNVKTGNLEYTFSGHTDQVTSLTFSPDMKFFVSGGSEQNSKSYLWNIETRVMSLISEHNNQAVSSIAYSHSGEMLAISSGENIISLWQTAPLKRLNYFPHTALIQSIFFVENDQSIVSVCYQKDINQSSIQWWNINSTNKPEFVILIDGKITNSKLSSDFSTLVGILDNKTLQFWDINSRSLINKLPSQAFNIEQIAVSSSLLAIKTADKSYVDVLDLFSGNLVLTLPVAENISSMCLSPQGEFFAFSTNDSFEVWHLPLYIHKNFAGNRIAWNTLKNQLAIVNDKTVLLWDEKTNKKEKIYTHGSTIQQVSFHPHKNILRLTDIYKTVLWDIDKQQIVPHKIIGSHFTWSSDGKKVATNDQNVKIIIWDTILEKEKLEISFLDIFGESELKNIHRDSLLFLEFSPDNRLLAIALNNMIVLWDIEKKRKYSEKTLKEKVSSMAFNNNGTEILIGSNHVVIWHIYDKESIALEKTTGIICKMCFLNNNLIASATTDGKILIWDIENKRSILSFSAQTKAISSLVYVPDKKMLLSAGDSYHVFAWQLFEKRKVNFIQTGHSKYKFSLNNNNTWEIDINIRDNPRQNALKLFGYGIGNDLSASPVFTPLYLWY